MSSSKPSATAKPSKAGPASVVVVGGTGLIGKHLCRQLLESGYKVIIASRNELHGRSFEAFIARTPEQRKRLRFIAFDAALEPHNGRDRPMFDALRTCRAVIMAGGEPLISSGGRQMTDGALTKALASRTRIVNRIRGILEQIQELRKTKNKSTKSKTKRCFLVLSSISYYGYPDYFSAQSVSEETPQHDDIWSTETRILETTAAQIQDLSLNYRVVCLRLPLVLEQSGGVLAWLLNLYKWGFGATLGEGEFSWFPWIHIYDVVRLVSNALENEAITGSLNCVAATVSHTQLAEALAARTGTTLWSWKHIPKFAVQALLGKPSAMVLHGRRVVSNQLQQIGFTFEFTSIGLALNDLLSLHAEEEEGPNGTLPTNFQVSKKAPWTVTPNAALAAGAVAAVAISAWRFFGPGKSESSNYVSGSPSGERVYIGDIVAGLLTAGKDAKLAQR